MTDARRGRAAAALLGTGSIPLVLASASERRRSLLEGLGLEFAVRATAVDESIHPGEAPDRAAVRLAVEKARAAARPGGGALVIAADTVVVVGDAALGKPRDGAEARSMIRGLSGREHRVVTGVAVARERDGALFTGSESTGVRFAALSEADVEALVEGEQVRDKAGAYAVQGLAGLVIERLEGDYYNVVGLPLALLRRLLHEAAGEGGAAAAPPDGRGEIPEGRTP